MKRIDIYSTCSYIDKVMSDAEEGVDMIYRGHSSCGYELKTSVGRIEGYTKDMEMNLFTEFKKNYRIYAKEYPETDLELLFMAQHYGVPTRLLDWTFNPLIALYFASTPNNDNDGKVYSIKLKASYNVEQLDDISMSIRKILDLNRCKYVIPYYTDIRYFNQKSIFLLSNHPNWKFDFADKETVYIIKNEAKSQLRKELAILGIDESFVFPTLDSLGKDVKERIIRKIKK